MSLNFKTFFFKSLKLNNKGFSLTELLITISILGILAAVAVPNYLKYKETSTKKTAKTIGISIHSAIEGCLDLQSESSCFSDSSPNKTNIDGLLSRECLKAQASSAPPMKDECIVFIKDEDNFCVSVNVEDISTLCFDNLNKEGTDADIICNQNGVCA